jgi:hypothetical protein
MKWNFESRASCPAGPGSLNTCPDIDTKKGTTGMFVQIQKPCPFIILNLEILWRQAYHFHEIHTVTSEEVNRDLGPVAWQAACNALLFLQQK